MTNAAWAALILLAPSAVSAQSLAPLPLESPAPAVEPVSIPAGSPIDTPVTVALDGPVALDRLEALPRALLAASEDAREEKGAERPEIGKLTRLFDRAGAQSAAPFVPLEVNGSRRVVLGPVSLLDSFRAAEQPWKDYQTNYRRASSGAPVVTDPKRFFSEAYGFGQLLWTRTTIGPRISTEMAAASARRIVRRHFEPRAPEAASSFDSLIERARAIDSNSPNRFRKRLQEALLEASLLPAEAIARYWDGKIDPGYRSRVDLFRRLRQPAIVDSFLKEAEALLVREESAHPGPDRYNIAAVLVTGSLVYGSGLPESDLDFFPLTWDGTSRHAARFMEKLDQLRLLKGWPDWPDKKRHPYALPVDGWFAPRLASEFQSLVATPHPEISETYGKIALSRPFYRTTWLQRLLHRATEPLYRLLLRSNLRERL